MKMLKKVCWLLLALSLSLGIAAPAMAGFEDPQSMEASNYLDSYSAYIEDRGGGKLRIWFDVAANDIVGELGASTIVLQEQAPNSSSWTNVKTYSCQNYSEMLGHNATIYANYVSYNSGKTGYTYRAYVTVWAGNNGIGDSRGIYGYML